MKIIRVWSFCILAIGFLMSCNTEKPTEGETTDVKKAEEPISLISCVELQEALNKDKGIQLVDVRTPEEYEGGTIAHATNIDFHGTNFKEKFAEVDKTKPLYIFCAKGGRSASAAKTCNELGFEKVYDLGAGYDGCGGKVE